MDCAGTALAMLPTFLGPRLDAGFRAACPADYLLDRPGSHVPGHSPEAYWGLCQESLSMQPQLEQPPLTRKMRQEATAVAAVAAPT
jgi:hypothetical protein